MVGRNTGAYHISRAEVAKEAEILFRHRSRWGRSTAKSFGKEGGEYAPSPPYF
jgi:hypothetical protein